MLQDDMYFEERKIKTTPIVQSQSEDKSQWIPLISLHQKLNQEGNDQSSQKDIKLKDITSIYQNKGSFKVDSGNGNGNKQNKIQSINLNSNERKNNLFSDSFQDSKQSSNQQGQKEIKVSSKQNMVQYSLIVTNLIDKLKIDSKTVYNLKQSVQNEIEKEQLEMGYHQIEQISKRKIFENWRVFDATTGNINYMKKFNLQNFGAEASSAFFKELKVFHLFESSSPPCTQLLSNPPLKAELHFEGGIATLWEMHIEYFNKQYEWNEIDLIYLILELIKCVRTLSSKGVYHNNIKPQNIILQQIHESFYQIKLVNFEGCTLISQQQDNSIRISDQKKKKQYQTKQDDSIKVKTDIYYDLSLKYEEPHNLISSQMYQIGRTILNLMIPSSNNSSSLRLKQKLIFLFSFYLLFIRQNNPFNAEEVLRNSDTKYSHVVPTVQTLLNFSHLSQATQNQNLNQISLIAQQESKLEKELVKLKEKTNGARSDCIQDVKGVLQTISMRRRNKGAWVEDMQIENFKREMRFAVSLKNFERGCDLCNYYLNLLPQQKYYPQLIEINRFNQNYQTLQQMPVPSNVNEQSTQSVSTIQKEPRQIQEKKILSWVKKPPKKTLKKDNRQFVSIEHEFYVKAEEACKKFYSRNKNQDILYTYFELKKQLSKYFSRKGLSIQSFDVCKQLINEMKRLVPADKEIIGSTQILLADLLLEREQLSESQTSLQEGIKLLYQEYPGGIHIEIAKGYIIQAKLNKLFQKKQESSKAANIAFLIANACSPNTLEQVNIAEEAAHLKMNGQKVNDDNIADFEFAYSMKSKIYNNPELNELCDNDLIMLGSLFEQTNNFQKSHRQYNQLLIRRKNRALNLRNPNQVLHIQKQLAQAHSMNAQSLERLEQLDKALIHHCKALSQRQQMFGEYHLDVADSYENLSIAHMNKKEYQSALSTEESALNIREKLVRDSLETSQSWSNMGIISQGLQNYDEAIFCHEKSLAMKKNIQGEMSEDVSNCYYNASSAYLKAGNPKTALEFAQKSLQIRKNVCQSDEELCPILQNMVSIHQDLGNYEESQKTQEQLNNINFKQQSY